ncbi:MAG: hypothetical protein JST62_01080 [Bacteroidetes bacterium]|nr:hypothetical protein [Bacteroidota bacterium]
MKEKYIVDSAVSVTGGTVGASLPFTDNFNQQLIIISLGILSPFLKEGVLFLFRKYTTRKDKTV